MDTRRKQFAASLKKHDPRTGVGNMAFRTKGYKFPTQEQMDDFRKLNIVYDIDEKLRDVIIDLNKHGYRTQGSCAGHTAGHHGFITFGLSEAEIKARATSESKGNKYVATKIYQSLVNHTNHEQGSVSPHINLDKIKTILKNHGLHTIKYTKPDRERLFHAFTFDSLSPGAYK
jgi:hypothetical protein